LEYKKARDLPLVSNYWSRNYKRNHPKGTNIKYYDTYQL
jgi:hypothetical protein